MDVFNPRRLTPVIVLIFTLSRSVIVEAEAICYRQDNHSAARSLYSPCNNLTPFTMCWRTQDDGNGHEADTRCLPNGLAVYRQQYWREGCTDPTWTSPYCLNAFDACQEDENSNVEVTPCDGTDTSSTWCCGENNTACCNTAGAVTIAAVLGPVSLTTSASPSSTSSPSTTSAPSSSSASASSSTTPSPLPSGGLSTGAKAGIGVAVGLIALAVLSGVVSYVLRRRNHTGKGASQLGGTELYPVGELSAAKGESYQRQPLNEAPGDYGPGYGVGRYQDEPVEMGGLNR